MKSLLPLLLLASLLAACTGTDGTDGTDSPESEAPEITASEPTETTEPAETDANLRPIDTDEALIATALMAAPEASRAGATVIGYNTAGEFVTLREGDNEFICLADNPNQEGFNAACYHQSLEPFMARGRELKAEGKDANTIFDIREKEVKSGQLKMGDTGSTLHIYYGPDAQYDPATGKVPGAIYRYVVYMPFATAESTGLPERPIAPNHPWIMNPGTHRAHIMISPVAEEGE
jgi:hypothetical protein